ncbi:hypothetical protein LCGC14_3010560, partial [marine sediment metagenome]
PTHYRAMTYNSYSGRPRGTHLDPWNEENMKALVAQGVPEAYQAHDLMERGKIEYDRYKAWFAELTGDNLENAEQTAEEVRALWAMYNEDEA